MAGHQGTATRNNGHESLAAMIEAERREIFTTVLGKTISYDATKQTGKFKVLLKRKFGDTELEAPDLEDVHVRYPRMGGFIMHVPLKAGDFVTLHAVQRNTDDYHTENGKSLDNAPGRMHALSDCFAVPGCYPVSMPATVPANGVYIGTVDGKKGITINDAGQMDFKHQGDSQLAVIRDFLTTFKNHLNGGAPVDAGSQAAAAALITRINALMA
jgi:Phage protein Gp138 N-terminal domain